jgi:hypothetical protein
MGSPLAPEIRSSSEPAAAPRPWPGAPAARLRVAGQCAPVEKEEERLVERRAVRRRPPGAGGVSRRSTLVCRSWNGAGSRTRERTKKMMSKLYRKAGARLLTESDAFF